MYMKKTSEKVFDHTNIDEEDKFHRNFNKQVTNTMNILYFVFWSKNRFFK
jgi:hypothetical protein